VKRKSSERIDVEEVMEDFLKSEESSSHRNGTFKIDMPFDHALDRILQSKFGTGKYGKAGGRRETFGGAGGNRTLKLASL